MSLICIQDLEKQKDSYCQFLDQELYFEAHEALELLWFKHRFKDDQEIRLIRAYINAAVSFELHKRGRSKAALKPWGFFQKHHELIKIAPPLHQEHYEHIYDKIITTADRFT